MSILVYKGNNTKYKDTIVNDSVNASKIFNSKFK